MKEKVTLPATQKTKDGAIRKKSTSITVRLLRAITITIISIVAVICAVVGFQLYKKNIAQFDEFTAQQFSNIEVHKPFYPERKKYRYYACGKPYRKKCRRNTL